MTDKHDKLVEMALASGAQYHVTTDPGVWLELDAEALAAFAAAHVASLCAGVGPFWHAVVSERSPVVNKAIRRREVAEEYARACSAHCSGVEVIPLVPASTVAAITAQRDQALARVAELEKDAARLDFVCSSPNRMVERESGLWRVYEDVAPTDHPTAVWQGMSTRWHVSPREAIDAAIAARNGT